MRSRRLQAVTRYFSMLLTDLANELAGIVYERRFCATHCVPRILSLSADSERMAPASLLA
jgi:hypothetical protein